MGDPRTVNGVDMSQIKILNTAEIPQKWTSIYEVDFKQQTETSWAGDGAGNQRSLEGINWIAGNTAYASSVSTTAADGAKMVITSAQASSRWFSFEQTGPIIFASLDDICTAAGFTYDPSHTLAIQALCDFTVDTVGTSGSYFYGGVYVGDGNYGPAGGGPGGRWYHTSWLKLGAPDEAAYARIGGGPGSGDGNNSDTTWTGTRPTFLELVIYPGTNWAAAAGTNTTFPDPLTTTTGLSYGNMQLLGPPINIGDGTAATIVPGLSPEFTLRPGASSGNGYAMYVGVWAAYLTNDVRDSAITCNFSKFRVLKRNT